ncbi:anti-sigma factor domain-containing protein [Oscillibacter sp. MSJ-2]|uniref:Anti-sigma factor domain-containing protein n=1 Tax=Dysosmobacter acutus TaxID=2841504 RepID=A0ABS6FBQ2_9FIRM|nr:anti-sigma factor domain-containing protein [Dysosmobacter acutus]MBU5626769.1 anti-sigma factor domain-containing protein [Dysosmobacter acutus]
MIDKAVVLELKESYALAMKEGGAVVRIRRRPQMAVGQRIYVLPEDLYQDRGKVLDFAPPVRRTGARMIRRIGGIAAACLVCISLLLTSRFLTPTAYAVVSLEAEQGIQVVLDKNYNILSAVSTGGDIPESVLAALKGRSILEMGPELERLVGGGTLLIGYAPEREEARGMEGSLRDLFQSRTPAFLSGRTEDVQAAERSGVSLGRYIAGRLMTEDDDLEDLDQETLLELLAQDARWMEVPEFREALEEKREEQEEQEEERKEPDESDDPEESEEKAKKPADPEEDPDDPEEGAASAKEEKEWHKNDDSEEESPDPAQESADSSWEEEPSESGSEGDETQDEEDSGESESDGETDEADEPEE